MTMRWIWLVFLVSVGCRSTESELSAEVRALRDDVATLTEDVGGLQEHMRLLCRAVEQAVPLAPDCRVLPPINGLVLMVSDQMSPELISIDRGGDDGVRRGFTFHVFSAGQYKGHVRVINVQAATCTAIIENLYEGRTIEAGDQAATHL